MNVFDIVQRKVWNQGIQLGYPSDTHLYQKLISIATFDTNNDGYVKQTC